MQLSTILLYRLKKSLKEVRNFYLFLFAVNYLLPFILSLISNFSWELTGTISPFFFLLSFLFFFILIVVTEKKDYQLFSQFNVSRRRHFLSSCLQVLSLALLITCIYFIINAFLHLITGVSYSFETNVPFLRNPIIGFITLFITIFAFYTFVGSLGLLISYLVMKFSKILIFISVIGIPVAFYQFLAHSIEGIVINLDPIFLWILGETENGVNLLYPISLATTLILINLGISKLINRTIHIKKAT